MTEMNELENPTEPKIKDSTAKYILQNIEEDCGGWGYEILNVSTGEIELQGDGFDTEKTMIESLNTLNEAFRCIFG